MQEMSVWIQTPQFSIRVCKYIDANSPAFIPSLIRRDNSFNLKAV